MSERLSNVTGDAAFDPFGGPQLLATAPSTEPQREIWTVARLGNEGSLAFNESCSLRFSGALDVAALRMALDDLVARHEALRTTFSADGLTLCVNAPAPVDLPLLDLTALPEVERAAALEELLAHEVEEPFDLTRGPLLRARLVRRAHDEHQLVFTAHHIVFDGWSTAVAMSDLGRLYTARLHGGGADLPQAMRFSDYAREQAEAAGTAAYAEAERYWLAQFAGELPVLELPSDRPRPALRTYFSRREDIVLDANLMRSAKKMGAKAGASFFTTLLAAFKVLLLRLTGQEDIVVGIPAAGQSVGGCEALVGHCVNTLPLRTQIGSEMPFVDALRAVRKTMLDAYDHQQHTFGALVRKLPIERDPSRPPIVSVVFNLEQRLAGNGLPFEGLNVGFHSNPRHFENFDLFVNVVESPERVVLECQYNTSILDRATVTTWIERFERLLHAAALDPSTPVGRLPILSDAERHRLLVECNAAPHQPRPERALAELFAEQVEARPNATAIACEDDRLTYAELERRANQLARRLQRAHVGPDDVVGIALNRSPESVVAVLAVAKAGGAYLSLEPTYPTERLAFMLQDAGVRVVVSVRDVAANLPAFDGTLVLLDAERAALASESTEPLPVAATGAHLAYVTYTSGSTGQPKGVAVPQHGVQRLVKDTDWVTLGPDTVFLHTAALAFDASTFEIWGPLLNGGCVVPNTEGLPTALGLGRVIARHNVTHVLLVTALLNALVDEDPLLLKPVREVLFGGESASPDHVRRAFLALPATRFVNVYGPTECTTIATAQAIERIPDSGVRSIPIGRPIADTRAYVLDRLLEPVPPGVVGELYLGGAGVARGYLNRPQLTAERFIPDPFGAAGERLYRTGDLARYLQDGALDFLGRADTQVKVHGYRIELGEIEARLCAHPGVAQAAVLAREDAPGEKRLVAYVVRAAGSVVGDDALVEHLGRTLPRHMVPQLFVFLETLPLSASGKIDRRRLPAPSLTAGEYVAPRTPSEELVGALWQQALSVPRVSVHDNFFKLGGHSLLAMQVLSRLNREHQVVLPLRTIFEAPTVARLAEVVDRERRRTEAPPVARIPRRAGRAPARASLMQERLLLLEDLDPERRQVHNVPSAFHLRGSLDVRVLERSLEEIVLRHETLRTGFQRTSTGFQQVVGPPYECRLAPEDLTCLTGAEQEEHLKARLVEIISRPFDLAQGPLFRAHLFRLGPDEHVFLTVRHNTIWDGWSFDIFRHELSTLYAAGLASQRATLPTLALSYSDFAEWHREWLTGPEAAQQMEYWRQRLSGNPPAIELPTARPRPPVRSFAGANDWVNIPRTEADALTALGQAHDATLFMVMLAAFYVLLYRYTGQTDLIVACPVRARTRPEVEDLIGLFTNTLMMRTALDPHASFLELLTRVRGATLDAFSHQELPFDLLVDQAPPVRVLFSMQEARHRATALGDVELSLPHVLPPAAAVDVNFWVVEMKDQLTGALNYSTELFESEFMAAFLEQYRRILRAVATNPRQAVAHIPLLEADERLALLRHAQPTPPPDNAPTVHGLIEEQARRRPQATALVARGQATSYAELDHRASGFAAYLADVATGAAVALATRQTDERIIALLGALRACRPVVVLDPADPPARLDALLAETRPGLLLADADLARGLRHCPDRVLHVLPDSAAGDGAPAVAATPATVAWHHAVPDVGGTVFIPLRHGSLARRLADAVRRLGLTETDTALVLPGASSFEALLPLAAGASVVVLDGDDADGGETLRDALASCGVTFLCASAARWWSLLASGWHVSPELTAVCPDLSPELASELVDRVDALFSAYVVEEVGGWCALAALTGSREHLPVGEPLDGVRLAVLDASLEAPPAGVPGVLHAGCDRENLEALDPQRLVPAATAEEGAPRFVRTDDRARYRPDGEIEVLTRSDRLAWIDGRRVAVDAVAAELSRHAALADVAVRGVDIPGQGQKLAAYVVPKPDQVYTDSELRSHLRGVMPRYAIPSHIVETQSLPRRGDGRVALERLPLPFGRQPAYDESVTPRSASERLLAALWTETLGVAQVGLTDNFFNLGGHSLLCLKVVARVERETGKKLNPRSLLLSTLEQAAAALDQTPVSRPVSETSA